MGATQTELERAASAVLVAELAAGDELAPESLARLQPAGIHVSTGGASPRSALARLRAALAQAGAPECFAACELVQGTSLPWMDATRLPSALALAAADSGRGRSASRQPWFRGAGSIAGSEARAAGIDLALVVPGAGDLGSFGDDAERAMRRARELSDGARLSAVDLALDQRDAQAGDGCALAPEATRGAWSGLLLADGRNASAAFDGNALACALANGCDGALVAGDAQRTRLELIAAAEAGTPSRERLLACAARMRGLGERLRGRTARPSIPDGVPAADRRSFAREAAEAALCQSGRWSWRLGRPCELLAPLHPVESLEARTFLERTRLELAGSDRPGGALLPVVAECALHEAQLAEVDAKLGALRSLGWPVGLLWLASPRWLPRTWWNRSSAPVLLAFDAAAPTLAAVRRWLGGELRASGSLPCTLR